MVLVLSAAAATTTERGMPLISVFPPEVHKAGPQTFDIAQDSRGVLYFGNLHGLVTYDGAWWRLLKLPEDQVALSVAADSRGRVALGLVNDFGYLEHDAGGIQRYRSLLPTIPAAAREVRDVRSTCSTPAGFLFVTERSVILWNGSMTRIAAEFAEENAPRRCLADGGDVYLYGPAGLQRFDVSTQQIGPVMFAGHVAAAVRRTDGRLILATREQGLFLTDPSGSAAFAPAASAWLKGKIVTSACRLHDGRLVIATRSHGIALLEQEGAIDQVIGADAGLPDAVLTRAHADREGSLWLAMEGPLVRIDVASPVTLFDARRRLRGSASDVARYGGKLYAAMTHGLYTIDAHGMATRVEGIEEGAWRLLSVDDELLIGTAKGLYRIDRRGALTRVFEREGRIYDIVRSTENRDRIWLAQDDGIGSIVRAGDGWHYEGLVASSARDISTVLEQDGIIWAGTVFDGILRVDEPRSARPRVTRFDGGEMNVYEVRGRPLFVRASGEILHVNEAGALVRDPSLGHISAPGGFFVIAEDSGGGIWINSTPPQLFERLRDGQFAREGRPLVSVTAADIQNLRVTADGVVWFASDKGLFRYEPGAAGSTLTPQPTPSIRRVIAGENRILYTGTFSQAEPTSLRHDFGRIRIEFAPLSYRPGVTYQYRLDPVDESWSEWTDEPFIDYTMLAANDYTFRVRARGPGMVAGGEARWSFVVPPPWYRTIWAYTLWFLLAAFLVAVVIRLRTGALHRQAENLRARVAEKTAALQETVQLLEIANAQLETMSLEDVLTGIANRRSFERALHEEWNRARRHLQPIALILLDLDYFKDLNDRRGHPAGDDCLRRIGAFLAQTVRRSGEIVARYGGEEFAILLPGVDGDAAVRVAEALRDGIEKLGIPYGNGASRRVTTSCGVAAFVPAAEMTPDTLVASADRALYAAKHSGRNCVRVADGTATGTWLRHVSA